jgi:hypothetical protein
MNDTLTKCTGSLILLGALFYASPVHGQNNAMSQAEARQMQEQFTPQAQYRLSEREARAAYQDAVRDCQQMDRTKRSSCVRDARDLLRQDLADARQKMYGSTNYGGSGTEGSTSSGSDAGSR